MCACKFGCKKPTEKLALIWEEKLEGKPGCSTGEDDLLHRVNWNVDVENFESDYDKTIKQELLYIEEAERVLRQHYLLEEIHHIRHFFSDLTVPTGRYLM